MSGIYGVLTTNNVVKCGYELFTDNTGVNYVRDEIALNNNFIFGRVVLDKFNQDRFLYENEEVICCFEGINYSNISSTEKFIQQLSKDNRNFLRNLRGVFTGFLFNKKTKKITVFNDHFSTKNVYYYYSEEHGLIFSSRLYVLTKIMKLNKIPLEYNLDGIYSLALYGQLFFDSTMIKNVYKLDYGSTINFDAESMGNFSIDKYFTLKKVEKNISFDKALSQFEELIRTSIEKEWQKDKDYGYKHISLLSGGMDSRTNFMLAKEMGFENITTYCYGNPGSDDMKISSKIAEKESYSHITHQINNGQYLISDIIENYLKLSDGTVLYTPSATMRFSLEKVNFANFGLLHSGQIGDVIGGTFNKPNFNFEKNIARIGWNGFVKEKNMLEKVTSLEKIIDKYKHTDFELYAYEQRVTNCVFAGDRVANNFTDHVSPFYDIDLNEFILSLPNNYRIKHKFYYSWLKKYHPEVLNYKWQQAGVKPNHLLKIKYGSLYKKYHNGFKKYFNLKYEGMNPIGNWLSNDPNILKQMDTIFSREISTITNYELAEDLSKIYNNNIFEYRNKFTVIGILLSLKIHFQE